MVSLVESLAVIIAQQATDVFVEHVLLAPVIGVKLQVLVQVILEIRNTIHFVLAEKYVGRVQAAVVVPSKVVLIMVKIIQIVINVLNMPICI